MKKLIFLMLLLGACDPQVCDKEKTANFIIECARAANPMSDEEGEDLVAECGRQARFIFCEFKK